MLQDEQAAGTDHGAPIDGGVEVGAEAVGGVPELLVEVVEELLVGGGGGGGGRHAGRGERKRSEEWVVTERVGLNRRRKEGWERRASGSEGGWGYGWVRDVCNSGGANRW